MGLVIYGGVSYGPRIVKEGLVAHLDAAAYGGSGNWNDLGTSSLNGSLSNVTFSTSNAGIMSFNGVNSKVILPDVSITNSGKLTVEVWVYSRNTTQVQDIIDTADSQGIWFSLNHPFAGVGTVSTSLSPTFERVISTFNFNQWNQVVCVADGINFKQYINGVYKGQTTGTCVSNINFNTARLGQVDGDRASEYLDGYIANVKIYNRDLSASEVIQNYNALSSRFSLLSIISSSFSPLDYTPIAWYDSSDVGTITKDGSNYVSQWNDKSGNNYNLVQGIGASQPLYSATNGIVFDGNDFMSKLFTIPCSYPYTLFVVHSNNNSSPSQNIILGAINNILLLQNYNNTIQFSNGAVLDYAKNLPYTKIISTIVAKQNGQTSFLYENNIEKSTNLYMNNTSIDGLSLGKWRYLGTDYFGNSTIKEIVLYPSALTTDQITVVNNYLNQKYSVY
jgi:hypothetical protein